MSDAYFEFEKSIGHICKYVPTYDLEYLTHISLKNKYMYIETPKVACSTIKKTLHRIEYENPDHQTLNFGNIHNRQFSPLLKPSQTDQFAQFINRKDIYKFCFVRNPYTRLLSAYLDKIRGGKEQKMNILLQTGRDMTDYCADIPFHEFVDAVCEQPFSAMDIHWRPQYYQTFQDSIQYDFIGNFETFVTDFPKVVESFSGSAENAQIYISNESRHATNASNLIDKFYGIRLKRKVYKKYKIDFEKFGYSK